MFILPPLPYAKTALAPLLNEEQLSLHYEKHHKSYVDNLNKLIEADTNNEFKGKSLEEIVLTATGEAFNNSAQIWNHTFYWLGLTPKDQGTTPSPELSEAIKRDFGNADALKSKFVDAGVKTFGSGWVWLCVESGKLTIVSTSNAAVPFKDVNAIPLLVADVWEHAYYVDYRNDRKNYLETLWSQINWKFVSENFAAKKVRNLTSLHRSDSAAQNASI